MKLLSTFSKASSGAPSRRHFLRTSLGAAAGAAVVGPNIVKAETLGNKDKAAANSRIGIGFVGMGIISGGHLSTFSGHKEMQAIGVCDVKPDKLKWAGDYLRGQRSLEGFVETSQFEELIAHKDLDALCVTTPDHWHAGVALAAMKAGKDVYVEKPMTLTMEESFLMREAEKKFGRLKDRPETAMVIGYRAFTGKSHLFAVASSIFFIGTTAKHQQIDHVVFCYP